MSALAWFLVTDAIAAPAVYAYKTRKLRLAYDLIRGRFR